jgi:hypothetical protein
MTDDQPTTRPIPMSQWWDEFQDANPDLLDDIASAWYRTFHPTQRGNVIMAATSADCTFTVLSDPEDVNVDVVTLSGTPGQLADAARHIERLEAACGR